MIYLVLVVGLILRLISLNQSLWLDEATSALVAKMPVNDIFTKFLPGDFHPPLYYLVLKFWVNIFGSSEISLRIPSVLFGIGAIFALYLIGKELFNKKTAIMAALFLATSGLHVYYSQEARMYSLATLFVVLSVYLFIKKRWLLLSLSLLAVGMTDYVSLFILPALLILAYKEWKKVFVSWIPLVIGFLIWLPIFFRQLMSGMSVEGTAWWHILGTATFKNVSLIPVKFIIGRISFDNKLGYLILVAILLPFVCYLLVKARDVNKILWVWLVVPIVVGIFVSLKIPALSYFRFLFCLPAFYLLITCGIAKVPKYENIFFGIMLAINIAASSYYLFNPRFYREDWRGLVNTVGDQKIVFPRNSQKEVLTYYGIENQIISVGELSVSDSEIWLSRYVWEIFDSNDTARRKVEELGYNKTSEFNFNGVVLWKYNK